MEKERIDYTRMYLVINLKGEDYPMLIKLSNQPHRAITSMFQPQIGCSFMDGEVEIEFYTNHIIEVDTIYGVRAKVHGVDGFGQYHCTLTINEKRLNEFFVEMLDDCSSYIMACRQYFKDEYGVSYDS